MRKTVLIAFSLLALAATAQGQTTMRQTITGKVNNVHTENLTKLVIVSDVANYVLITPTPNAVGDEVPSGLLSVKGFTLSFENMAALYNIELHLNTRDLTIHAEEKSEVLLRGRTDTLRLRNLKVRTEDLAVVTIEPFVKANRVDFYSEDLSQINHNGFYANSGTEYYLGETTPPYNDDTDDTVRQPRHADPGTYTDSRAADNPGTQPRSTGEHRRQHYDLGDRTSLVFLWGWNNWGDGIANGLMSFDDGYELTTTFTSYQLAFTYDFVKTPVFSAQIGIGYESDVYRFSNSPVELTPTADGAMAFTAAAPTIPGYKESRTKLVTRYVTLPVSVVLDIDNFQIGLAAIPGMGYCSNATGVKTKTKTTDGTTKQTDHTINHYLNPYKFDARLSIGWGNIGMFFQPSFMPVFLTDGDNRMDRKVYPVKFGFQLGF